MLVSLHKVYRALRLVAALLLTVPMLTGCWDRLEIEQRATVLGIAIDEDSPESDDSQEKSDEDSTQEQDTENSNSSSGKSSDGSGAQELSGKTDVTGSSQVNIPQQVPLRLTAQIAVPGRIPLGPGESGGSSTSTQSAVWVVYASGKTINDALQELQQKVADKLFLGHLRVIVVSEEYAREQGLESLSDGLRRNPEIRRTAWLVVAKGNATEVMKTSPPLERVPTLYLMATLDHSKQLGKLPNYFLGVFESQSVMKGRDPVLPYVDVQQKDNINIGGLALFQRYKMVDTTRKSFDVSSYMQLSGVRTGGYSMMLKVPGGSEAVVWQAYRRRRRIKVDIERGQPHFRVTIHVDGNIIGKSSDNFRLDDPEVIRSFDTEVTRRGLESIRNFIHQTQQDDTDCVGFGEYVRAREPGYWDRYIKTKEKWREIYPTVKIDVRLTVRTHRIGMKGM